MTDTTKIQVALWLLITVGIAIHLVAIFAYDYPNSWPLYWIVVGLFLAQLIVTTLEVFGE